MTAKRFVSLPQFQLGLLAVVTLVSRLIFASDRPTEWDSVQLVLGVDRFDVTVDSPHAPGYWVWITLAEAIRTVTWLDAHQSLVLMSAVCGVVAVVLSAMVGYRLGGSWVATLASAVMFCSPHMWFYGSIAATYLTDVVVMLSLLLLALRAQPGTRHGLYAALALALGAGLRPTMLLIYGPLAAVVMLRSIRSVKQFIAAGLAGAGAVLVWLVPLVLEQPGGWSAWRAASSEIFAGAAEGTAIFRNFDGGVANIFHTSAQTVIAMGPFLLLGALATAIWLVRSRRLGGADRWAVAALLAAIIPPLAFVALVHFAKGGYVLSYMPAVVLGALFAASRWPHWAKTVVAVVVAGLCLLGVQRFVVGEAVLEDEMVFEISGQPFDKPASQVAQFIRWSNYGAPYRFTSAEMDRINQDLDRFDSLPVYLDPGRDVVVTPIDNGGHRYRHLMHDFPEVEVNLIAGGTIVSRSQHGQTTEPSVNEIALTPGGRAIFVIDSPNEETRAQLDAAVLPSGATVWIAEPGDSAHGITVMR